MNTSASNYMVRNNHVDINCSAIGLFHKKSLADTTCKVSFVEFFTQMFKIISFVSPVVFIS